MKSIPVQRELPFPPAALLPEMLTPEEIEGLRQEARKDAAFFPRAFAELMKQPPGHDSHDKV